LGRDFLEEAILPPARRKSGEEEKMPSMVTHAAVGVAAAAAFAPRSVAGFFQPASVLCATVQDLDVIGFYFGLPYGHILGHRGFTHSLFLGLFAGLLLSALLSRDEGAFSKGWFFYLFFFFLVWASHGVLDALTRGGRGAALLWPFDNHRIFFSWTPIPISPIGLSSFFSNWGLHVLKNEIFWVWLPSFSLAFFARVVRILA